MADFKQGFVQYLLSLTGVTGSLLGSRIYPDDAPQNPTFPYATYYIQDDEKPTHLAGASAYSKDTVSVLVYATTPENRTAVTEVLRNALHGRINIEFPQDSGTLKVRSVWLQGISEMFEAPTDDSEQGAYVAQMDFLVNWVEAVPTHPS